jgi:membrane-associated phospholipid phosphatase
MSLPHLKVIEGHRDKSLTKVFSIVSDLSDKNAYAVIIAATYHLLDVKNAFVVTCTIYTALGVLSVLKSFNHEARPFFVADITPTKCWLEYGNPSGHSITSSSLYLTVWYMLCKRYEADQKWRRISLALTLSVVFLIAFSRIYHGVHTYNQILLGWALGGALHYFFCHVMYRDLTHFVGNIHRYSWKTLFFNKGTGFFYLIYAIAIFNFVFGEMIHPAPKEWADTIRTNCAAIGGDASKYDDAETENFVRFNLASTIAGSYLGLIIEQKFVGTRIYRQYNRTQPF